VYIRCNVYPVLYPAYCMGVLYGYVLYCMSLYCIVCVWVGVLYGYVLYVCIVGTCDIVGATCGGYLWGGGGYL
jgi:hypothetical protein